MPRSSDRDINNLLKRETYKSEAKSWSDTSPCIADGLAGLGNKMAAGEKKEVTIHRGELKSSIEFGSLFTRETSWGDCSLEPLGLTVSMRGRLLFDNLEWSCSGLRIRTITSQGRGQTRRRYWLGSIVKREGQSCEKGAGEPGNGWAGVVERAREQPSWVAWSYRGDLKDQKWRTKKSKTKKSQCKAALSRSPLWRSGAPASQELQRRV